MTPLEEEIGKLEDLYHGFDSLTSSDVYHIINVLCKWQKESALNKVQEFIESRIEWNEYWLHRESKATDMNRIEEDKCIKRYIGKIIKDETI